MVPFLLSRKRGCNPVAANWVPQRSLFSGRSPHRARQSVGGTRGIEGRLQIAHPSVLRASSTLGLLVMGDNMFPHFLGQRMSQFLVTSLQDHPNRY